MSLRPMPIHRYSIHHYHRRRLQVSVFVILSESIAEEPRLCHLLSPPRSEDFSLPPFILPRTFLSERNSLGSVDWPPIGSSLLPEDENARQDDNINLRSPVSDVPPRLLLIDLITHLRRPRRTGMTRSICVGRDYCLRSKNWMKLKFWKFIRIENTIDSAVIFIITKGEVPVFFLGAKTYVALNHAPSRKEADDVMRDRFLYFSDHVPLRKLYGISALGIRFSVYEYHSDTRMLIRWRILPDSDVVNDTAPQERWNYDVTTPEGEAKLKQIVGEIKEMAALSGTTNS
jgi:hypothetical protein